MLAQLEVYSMHLQLLTGPQLTEAYEREAEAIGTDFQNLGKRLADEGLIGKAPEISPGVAAVVTELGRVILRAKAQHDARRIAESANSNVVATLHLMAGSIGETVQSGLRGTVRQHWLGRLGVKKEEFKRQTTDDGRVRIARQFVAQMRQRDAQDAVLASLRRSLLSLAGLHQGMSRGDPWSVRQFAQMISEEVQATRQIYEQFKTKLAQ
jgi:hypothetical protein